MMEYNNYYPAMHQPPGHPPPPMAGPPPISQGPPMGNHTNMPVHMMPNVPGPQGPPPPSLTPQGMRQVTTPGHTPQPSPMHPQQGLPPQLNQNTSPSMLQLELNQQQQSQQQQMHQHHQQQQPPPQPMPHQQQQHHNHHPGMAPHQGPPPPMPGPGGYMGSGPGVGPPLPPPPSMQPSPHLSPHPHYGQPMMNQHQGPPPPPQGLLAPPPPPPPNQYGQTPPHHGPPPPQGPGPMGQLHQMAPPVPHNQLQDNHQPGPPMPPHPNHHGPPPVPMMHHMNQHHPPPQSPHQGYGPAPPPPPPQTGPMVGPMMGPQNPHIQAPPYAERNSPYIRNIPPTEFRIIELNKRLQYRPRMRIPQTPLPRPVDDTMWWDKFAIDFFDDDATLSYVFAHDPTNPLLKPLDYTIGRALIPRFFKSYFDSEVIDLAIKLRHTRETAAHPHVITLECDHTEIVTKNAVRQVANTCVVVRTEGTLVVDFNTNNFEQNLLIKSWRFYTRSCHEFIDRTMTTNASPSYLMNPLTKHGLNSATLSFLKMCKIMEPMQDLMIRHRQTKAKPQLCLKQLLSERYSYKAEDDTKAQPSKRRKRKAPAATGVGNTNATGKRNKINANNVMNNKGVNPTILASQDVMVVGEPSMLGSDFNDENERRITRLENNTNTNNNNNCINNNNNSITIANTNTNNNENILNSNNNNNEIDHQQQEPTLMAKTVNE